MTITAIETKHAGCRFRSRLEARWAVFFDCLKIRWNYEPQGYHLLHAWTGRPGTFSYLPDFYLPDLGLWAEVKGAWTTEECWRFLDAAAALSGAGHDTLLLGAPADVYYGRTSSPLKIGNQGGHLTATPWFGGVDAQPQQLVYGFVGQPVADALLHGVPAKTTDAKLKRALEAARSARFEYGEGAYVAT